MILSKESIAFIVYIFDHIVFSNKVIFINHYCYFRKYVIVLRFAQQISITQRLWHDALMLH